MQHVVVVFVGHQNQSISLCSGICSDIGQHSALTLDLHNYVHEQVMQLFLSLVTIDNSKFCCSGKNINCLHNQAQIHRMESPRFTSRIARTKAPTNIFASFLHDPLPQCFIPCHLFGQYHINTLNSAFKYLNLRASFTFLVNGNTYCTSTVEAAESININFTYFGNNTGCTDNRK